MIFANYRRILNSDLRNTIWCESEKICGEGVNVIFQFLIKRRAHRKKMKITQTYIMQEYVFKKFKSIKLVRISPPFEFSCMVSISYKVTVTKTRTEDQRVA